jgi:hypothetical protein
MAKMGISKQIKESTRASDMCSASVYGPTKCFSASSYSRPPELTFADGANGNQQ